MPRISSHGGPALHSLLSILLLAALIAWPHASRALPDDKEQPIHITADKAVRDEKLGVTIYSGHVELRQGSMELDADTLTIYHQSQDADKIVARGAPAKMRQRPEPDKGLVRAHGNIITYFRRKELVHLRNNARIEREDGTLVTGDSIDYFITKELVKAESDRTDEGNKVFVVIPPSLVEESEEETREPLQNAVDSAMDKQETGSAAEGSATEAEGSPAVAEGSPAAAEGSPATAEGSPATAEGSPTESEGSPAKAEGSPAAVEPGADPAENEQKENGSSGPTQSE